MICPIVSIILEKIYSKISFDQLLTETKYSWNSIQVYTAKSAAVELGIKKNIDDILLILNNGGALKKARDYMSKYKFDSISMKYDIPSSDHGKIYLDLKKLFKNCLSAR